MKKPQQHICITILLLACMLVHHCSSQMGGMSMGMMIFGTGRFLSKVVEDKIVPSSLD